jgi:hypothetical protein
VYSSGFDLIRENLFIFVAWGKKLNLDRYESKRPKVIRHRVSDGVTNVTPRQKQQL